MALRGLQVGCVWPSERGGGGDRVFADLAKYLPGNGVAVEAMVAGAINGNAANGMQLSSFGSTTDGTRARWLGARHAIRGRLDAGGVDVVATHFALYASAAVDRIRRLPHVVHFHGPWAEESREEGGSRLAALAKWSIERAVYRTADRFVVLSEAFGRLASREYGVPAYQIRVVPGAADLERFMVRESREEARRRLGWPSDRPILVSVRRLVRRTGVDRLIEALPLVVAQVPGVVAYIGGTGGLRGSLEQRAKALGLHDSVRFLGYVADDDLALTYRAADFNVIPTIALEGFGLTAVEALAAGTPSIVTPIGGLPEIMTPLCPALVLASATVDDIARGIIDAFSGREQTPSEAECRSFAVERFSADLMAKRVAAVYEEVCA